MRVTTDHESASTFDHGSASTSDHADADFPSVVHWDDEDLLSRMEDHNVEKPKND